MIEELRLRVGESARLGSGDVTVVFERVESDGRCPKGLKCVWEGDAVVRVSVGAARESRTQLSLHTHPDATQQGEASGFVVTLVALDPYPVASKPIEPGDYRLRLTATPARR
jgi:hypothetical protein